MTLLPSQIYHSIIKAMVKSHDSSTYTCIYITRIKKKKSYIKTFKLHNEKSIKIIQIDLIYYIYTISSILLLRRPFLLFVLLDRWCALGCSRSHVTFSFKKETFCLLIINDYDKRNISVVICDTIYTP
jgi:hypothetical protein